MAKIAIDATSLSRRGKGVSRYQLNLIRYLTKYDKKNEYLVFLKSKNGIPELPDAPNYTYIKVLPFNTTILEQYHMPQWFRKYDIDLLHTTTDRLPLLGNGKTVVYLFEIPDYRIRLSKLQAGLYKKTTDVWTNCIFCHSMRKASFIMVSSRSTERDLREHYNIDKDKIRVVYPAPEEIFTPPESREEIQRIRQRYGVEEGYLLHISSPDPRDNTETVLRAYSQVLQSSNLKQKLVIGGSIEPVKERLKCEINRLDRANRVVFTGYKSGKQLVSLYRGAEVYVDASLYEGFGFQVVEAMACGVPVITSNVTSLPEVVGDAAVLVDPKDAEGLASAMVRVLTDTGLRELMRHKSLERARFFSWDKTARETLKIYNEVLLQ